MAPAPRHPARLLAAGCVALAVTGVASPARAQIGPAAGSTGLSADVLALACAPMPTFEVPTAARHIVGTQDVVARATFAPGDLLVIDAGESQGVTVGQEFFVRHVVQSQRRRPTREHPGVVQTAGWIRIYAVEQNLSLATITHACDPLTKGDYLEPFVLPAPPLVAPKDAGTLRHDAYGRVTVGIEQKTTFGKGDFFILDRGSDHGVTPGMRFTVYRDKKEPGVFLFELGDAVAVSVQHESATLLVTRARDAFWKGDYVAMQK